jgi:hypothetical protein
LVLDISQGTSTIIIKTKSISSYRKGVSKRWDPKAKRRRAELNTPLRRKESPRVKLRAKSGKGMRRRILTITTPKPQRNPMTGEATKSQRPRRVKLKRMKFRKTLHPTPISGSPEKRC